MYHQPRAYSRALIIFRNICIWRHSEQSKEPVNSITIGICLCTVVSPQKQPKAICPPPSPEHHRKQADDSLAIMHLLRPCMNRVSTTCPSRHIYLSQKWTRSRWRLLWTNGLSACSDLRGKWLSAESRRSSINGLLITCPYVSLHVVTCHYMSLPLW